MSNFKRPANAQYRHYCGECAKFVPVEHEYARDMGMCSFDDPPSGKVSLAYMMTAVWRDQYEGACPLCECCGYSIGDLRWKFCPSCGAEVVDV